MSDDDYFPEEMLLEYRKILVDQHYQDSARFEQVMLTISTGVLGISVVFLKDIIGNNPAENSLIWLYLSWGFVVLSLLLILFSFTPAMNNKENLISQIDEAIKTQDAPTSWKSKRVARIMSSIAVICLGFGIGSYLIFAILNI